MAELKPPQINPLNWKVIVGVLTICFALLGVIMSAIHFERVNTREKRQFLWESLSIVEAEMLRNREAIRNLTLHFTVYRCKATPELCEPIP